MNYGELMLARKRNNASLKRALLAQAKKTLKERGWTYRAAAPVCKVKFEHFGKVLCGMRESGVLLKRISEIPPRTQVENETSQAN